jgi:hypothetical protein
MESACSLSSTHRIVLFGRILSFPPGIFPQLAGAVASTEVFAVMFVTLVQELYGKSKRGSK